MAEGWPNPPALLLLSMSACWALDSCPAPCSCPRGSDEIQILDCNRKRLSAPPLDPPHGITRLVHNRISELWMHQLHPYISLETLDLSSNSNSEIKAGAFPTMQLKYLELKRNKIKLVDSLTFKGMDLLKSLKMQRNGITKLMDGAFFGFNNMEVLDLSFNHLARLEETVFIGLGLLENLNLGENTISHLGEGVFSSLANLRSLDIRNNEISWAIEDSIGVFVGMKKLNTFRTILNLSQKKPLRVWRN